MQFRDINLFLFSKKGIIRVSALLNREGEFLKKSFILKTDFITLGQFLKESGIISSGGMSKEYLQEYNILVNGEIEKRRGRKLFSGTSVELPDGNIFFIKNKSEQKFSKGIDDL